MHFMGFQIGSFFVEMVIKFEVKVMSLKVRHNKNARDCTWKLPKPIIDMLGLQGNTVPEFFIMGHSTAPDCPCILIVARGVRVERSSFSKFPFGKGINRVAHIPVVRRSIAFKTPGSPVGLGSAHRSSVSYLKPSRKLQAFRLLQD